MKILITGGTGFLGRALARSFLADGYEVIGLARHAPRQALPEGLRFVQWDGRTAAGWGGIINEIDVVINLAGRSLASWPWTRAMKRQFLDSRAQAGRALAEAITQAQHRPRLLVQSSGINHYGLRGETATESTPPAQDFLARLTVEWEASTRSVEELGVRRVITRSAVVLAGRGGLLPLMALPVRLFVGGPLAGGRQAVPWIHLDDEVGAVRFLVDQE
ncbi:MAG TPA: NAD-dependent epimerase/dehydratase family protein, partial [Anaerolineales bacterium]